MFQACRRVKDKIRKDKSVKNEDLTPMSSF